MTSRGKSIEFVEVTPGIGTLAMFKFMDYSPWHAIAEFVDNSVSSWQQNQERLRRADGSKSRLLIEITFEPSGGGEIRIWDNAAGIAQSDYARAFKPAERPPDQSTLSRYGMGMKTAACWFSDNWQVSSKALGENVIRKVTMNVPELIAAGSERIEAVESAADRNEHWTEVKLWDLNAVPASRTVGKIRDYLAGMYRRFLQTGDVSILWNGVPLTYKERRVMESPLWTKAGPTGKKLTWEKSLTLKLPKGELIAGRALLFATGEQSAAGLHLFWRGRLIKGNLEDFYRPNEIFQFAGSYRVQRLLIELDMDDFNPTVDKKDFTWGRTNSSEEEFLKVLKRELNRKPLPLLDQADNFRQLSAKTAKAATVALRETAAAIEKSGSNLLTAQAQESTAAGESLPSPGRRVPKETILDLVVRNQPWKVTIQLSDRPADRGTWLQITESPKLGAKGARDLRIRLSLTNPFTLKFAVSDESMALLVRIAAALALAELASQTAGNKNSSAVRRNLNEFLHDVLATS